MKFLFEAVLFLLKKQKNCVSRDVFQQELFSHPDYPSLVALTDTLSILKIKYRVGVCSCIDLEQNGQMALIVCHSKFFVLRKIEKEKVLCYDPEIKKSKAIGRALFEQGWNGVALYVETMPFTFAYARLWFSQKIKKWGIALGGLFLFIALWNESNYLDWLYVLIKAFGVLCCVSLVGRHMKKGGSLLRMICENRKYFSCDIVLESKYSRILGISLTDIGMVYFGSTFLSCLYGITAQNIILKSWLLSFSLCSLPILLFSICYQGFVIKKWCPLCLSVMFALLMEIVVAYWCFSVENVSLNWDRTSLAFLLSSLFLFTSVWKIWKEGELHRLLSMESMIEFLRIKKNMMVFQKLLDQGKRVDLCDFGNIPFYKSENPVITLTVVMNIYCHSCMKIHKELIELYNSFVDKLSIRILLTGSIEKRSDIRNESSLYLLSVYEKHGIDIFEKELFRFFESPDKPLNKTYTFNEVKEEVERDYYKGLDWIKQNHVTVTPSIFVNDVELPAIYQVADLKYFLMQMEI